MQTSLLDIEEIKSDKFPKEVLAANIMIHESQLIQQPEPPKDFEKVIELKDGSLVLIRPLKPRDSRKLQEFFKKLGQETITYRFFSNNRYIINKHLEQLISAQSDAELVLMAIDLRDEKKPCIGISELLFHENDTTAAECAIVLADNWQGRGLGTKFLECLVKLARDLGVRSVFGEFKLSNMAVLGILRKAPFKFTITYSYDTAIYQIYLNENQ
jgi:acetyltransferase